MTGMLSDFVVPYVYQCSTALLQTLMSYTPQIAVGSSIDGITLEYLLDLANNIHDGEMSVSQGWASLASNGDDYAAAAWNLITYPDGVFGQLVRNYWEALEPGSLSKWNDVAKTYILTYISFTQLAIKQGRLLNTEEIETAYRQAVTQNGLPALIAIDGLFSGLDAKSSYVDVSWFNILHISESRWVYDSSAFSDLSNSSLYDAFVASVKAYGITTVKLVNGELDDEVISSDGWASCKIKGVGGYDFFSIYDYINGELDKRDYDAGDYEFITFSTECVFEINDGSDEAELFLGTEGNDNINGGDGNDNIIGDWDGEGGDDQLYGDEGDDRVWGDDGDDTLDGGNGNDLVYGGDGNDSISAGDGNDEIHCDGGSDSIMGGIGNDTIYSESGYSQIWYEYGDGTDSIVSGQSGDVLTQVRIYAYSEIGTASNVDIITTDGNGVINTSIALDRTAAINTTTYEDVSVGGGTFLFSGDSATNYTVRGQWAVELISGDGDDTFDLSQQIGGGASGGGGNDTMHANYTACLWGDEGNDVLSGGWWMYGGSGDDFLDDGSDGHCSEMIGGEGNDYYYFTDCGEAAAVADGISYISAPIYDDSGNDIYDYTALDDEDLTLKILLDPYSGYNAIYLPESINILEFGGYYDENTSKQYLSSTPLNFDGYYMIFLLDPSKFDENFEYRVVSSITIYRDDFTAPQVGQTWFDTQEQVDAYNANAQYLYSLYGTSKDDFGGTVAIGGSDGNSSSSGSQNLTAEEGGDQIYGGDASDAVSGASGDDILTGGGGGDSVAGGAGNDIVYGDSGNDTVAGGTGDDELFGGTGDDCFIYAGGDGHDTVSDAGDTDSLILNDLTPTDVTLRHDGKDLFVDVNGVLSVTIPDYITESTARIETIQFDDGTVWTISGRLSGEITGSSSADSLIGSEGADSFRGNAGADTLSGGADDDVYYYQTGDGSDIIHDEDTVAGNSDTLSFGAGIAVSDVSFSYDSSNLYFQLTDGSVITIENGSLPQYGIERVTFADGIVWDVATDIFLGRIVGTSEQDYLYGTEEADTFIGQGGEGLYHGDWLYGEGGNDTYVVYRTDGPTNIAEWSGTDTIQLIGFDPAEVTAYRSSDSLILTSNDRTTWVEIISFFSQQDYQIESVVFDDGTLWNLDQYVTLTEFTGTIGPDTLNGDNGSNTLSGGMGADYLYGSSGDDTYLYSRGDGNDYISDWNGIDQLFIEDIDTGDMKLTRQGGKLTAVINDGSIVKIGSDIDSIAFADGTVWTVSSLSAAAQQTTALTLTGTSAADFLVGAAGNDTLAGGGGDDTLFGGDGDDTYTFSRGDGADTIHEYAGSSNTLVFGSGIVTGDVTVRHNTTGDVILDLGGGDSVTLIFHDHSLPVDQVQFADGTIWSSDQIIATANGNGTSGADHLYGTSDSDSLLGGSGDDSSWDWGGSDTYYYSLGDGNDTISDYSSTWKDTDRIVFDSGVTASDVSLWEHDGDLVIAVSGNDGSITVTKFFSNLSYRIEKIVFTDGTEWTLDDIYQRYQLAGFGDTTAPAIAITTAASTNNPLPVISGTSEDGATITLTIGGTTYTTTAAGGVWSVDLSKAKPTTGGLLLESNGINRVAVTAVDIYGNKATASQTLLIDTTAPTVSLATPIDNATDVAVGDNITVTFNETVVASTGSITLYKSDGTTIETFNVATGSGDDGGSVNFSGSMITINPGSDLAYGTGYYVNIAGTAIEGTSGNAYVGIANTTTLNFTTVSGSTVDSGVPTSTSDSTTTTETTTSLGGSGTTTMTGSFSAGTMANVSTATTDTTTATSTLSTAINSSAIAETAKADAVTALSIFISTLATSTQVTVTILSLTSTDDSAETITITGSTGGTEAMVINVSNLPSGSMITLQNVEFAVIVGAVTVTGGEGQNYVIGDGSAQYIVLGPEDDTLAGGAGDDYVGSLGGNDKLYGDDGNDTVSGGADNDVLHGGDSNDSLDGGSGIDIAVFATSRSSATVTSSTVSGEGTDTLKDVELLAFTDGITLANTPLAGTFDETLYLAQNPDVAAAVQAGLIPSGAEHFATYGMVEGRDLNALFDNSWYLAQNPDVAAAVAAGLTTAWAHYESYGWKEGRDPSQYFDTRAYLDSQQDVALAGVNPLDHFLVWGAVEGRLATVTSEGAEWLT